MHLEAPECAVRRIMFAAAAHFKDERDGLPLHLERLLGPTRPQHRLAPVPVQVSTIFSHLQKKLFLNFFFGGGG